MTHPSLEAVLDAVRGVLRTRLGVSFGLASVGIGAVVLSVAWIVAGAEGWRQGTAGPAALLIAGVVGVVILGTWVSRVLLRWTSEASLSSEIERSTRLPEGAVLAQAELGRSVPGGVSSSLARAGERALLLRIRETPDRLAGDPGRRATRARSAAALGAGAAVVVVVALAWAAPERARAAWSGLAHPGAMLVRPVLPPLELLPGNAVLPRDEEPRVRVVAQGRESVTLHWRSIGELEESRVVPLVGGEGTLMLPPLQAELRYWATSPDGARTAEFVLTPSDPSLLVDVLVEVAYPAHTRLPPETFRGSPEGLSVPEGTVLAFSGGVQGEASEIRLQERAGGGGAVPMVVQERRFAGSLVAERSMRLEWIVNGGEIGALLPPVLDLDVVPDVAPSLSFPEPGSAGELPLSLSVPLLLEARDDYGVAWIEVETHLRSTEGPAEDGTVDRIPTGARPSVTLRPLLDFTTWALRPGEEVTIQARASDNAPSAHVVESEVYVLRMPRLPELRELVRASVDEVTSATEELLAKAREEDRELSDLERRTQLGQENEPAEPEAERERFQEREEIQKALERQAEMARQIEELQEQLTEAREVLPRDEEADQGLAERIEELEALLDSVLSEEERAELGELLERLQNGEPLEESLLDTVVDLAERQRQMTERLEQTLERLRQAVLEEAFRSAEEEVRSLQEEQTALVDSLRAGEGTDRQAEVAERTERAEERIGDIEAQLRDQGEPEAADRAEEARNELAGAREAMQQGIEEADAGDVQAAGDRAEEAAQALEEAAQSLEDGRSEIEDSWQEAMMEGLRAGARDALALARRQAELRSEFSNAGPARRSLFEGEQTSILEGLRNLANELAEATASVPELAAELSTAVGRAMASAEDARDDLVGSGTVLTGTEAAAERVHRGLNDVALLALAGLEQGGQESAQAGATMNQIRAEMEAMAAAQQSVNRGSSSLGQDPGADGQTARLEQLVQAQQTIAGTLGELSRQPGAGRALADLNALSEEARELAEELRQARLGPETLERQDNFLDLLLSAGLSLERDEPTEERESTAAAPTERHLVSPIPEYLLDARAVPFPSAEELEALSPAQRRLVLDYFERVNERRAQAVQ